MNKSGVVGWKDFPVISFDELMKPREEVPVTEGDPSSKETSRPWEEVAVAKQDVEGKTLTINKKRSIQFDENSYYKIDITFDEAKTVHIFNLKITGKLVFQKRTEVDFLFCEFIDCKMELLDTSSVRIRGSKFKNTVFSSNDSNSYFNDLQVFGSTFIFDNNSLTTNYGNNYIKSTIEARYLSNYEATKCVFSENCKILSNRGSLTLKTGDFLNSVVQLQNSKDSSLDCCSFTGGEFSLGTDVEINITESVFTQLNISFTNARLITACHSAFNNDNLNIIESSFNLHESTFYMMQNMIIKKSSLELDCCTFEQNESPLIVNESAITAQYCVFALNKKESIILDNNCEALIFFSVFTHKEASNFKGHDIRIQKDCFSKILGALFVNCFSKPIFINEGSILLQGSFFFQAKLPEKTISWEALKPQSFPSQKKELNCNEVPIELQKSNYPIVIQNCANSGLTFSYKQNETKDLPSFYDPVLKRVFVIKDVYQYEKVDLNM